MPRGTKLIIFTVLIGFVWLFGQEDQNDTGNPNPSASPALPSASVSNPGQTAFKATGTEIVRPVLRPVSLKPAPKTEELNPKPPKVVLGKTYYVTGSSVRVRAGPGTQHTHLTSFKRGESIKSTGETAGKWIRISHRGVEGWMHGDYLSIKKPVPTSSSKTKERKTRQATAASDDALRQKIIRQSISSYSGSCPCPYNRDRAGRRCGGRSAYSRPGGASPICYASDISQSMLARWR